MKKEAKIDKSKSITLYIIFIATLITLQLSPLSFSAKTTLTTLLSSTLVGFLLLKLFLNQKRQQDITYLFNQSKKMTSNISHILLNLEEKIITEKKIAISQERKKMGRDLHDDVGHTLTALSIQLKLASELEQDLALKKRLIELETLTRESLSHLRVKISSLREVFEFFEENNFYDRTFKMVEIFSNCTGVEIYQEIHSYLSPDDNRNEHLYYIIVEALTNSYKHGYATFVKIATNIKNGRFLLMVSDNGIGTKSIVKGVGTTGTNERVQELKGELIYKTSPNKGFDLGLSFPLNLKEEK